MHSHLLPAQAPEVLEGESYDASADLWSVGTIIYQCLTGKPPFKATSIQGLQALLKSTGGRVDMPELVSPELRTLLAALLQPDPKRRLTYEQFFKHPFLLRARQPVSAPIAIPAVPQPADARSSAKSGPTPEDTFMDGSYVMLDKEHVALNVVLDRAQRSPKESAPVTDPRAVQDFIALADQVTEPAVRSAVFHHAARVLMCGRLRC